MSDHNNGNLTRYDSDSYRVNFAHFASRLEQHLVKNGISCIDADMIIEDSSVFYFDRLDSSSSKFFSMLKKREPADVFVDSAFKAIEKHIPGATRTFGSHKEISKCIR